MSETPARARTRLIRKILIDLAIMTVIGVGLALIGPFGSFAAPLPFRLISWLMFSYLGYAIYSPMGAVVDWGQRALDLPAAGLWVAAVLAATVPMSILVWVIGYLPGPVTAPSLEAALTTYFYVLVIGGGVTALFYALENRKDAREEAAAPDQRAPSPIAESPSGNEATSARFLDRLPPALGSDLIALEMEDHYVRAHTSAGSDLILLRMRDAVAELDGIDGAQVHRSWWVAKDAVEGTRKDGRNIRLKLRGGLEAPVSRNAAPLLKEQGWY
ncbi:MAG: LytTR family DNA-binding domain-containing protein [Pontixanthobacter sp.]